MNQRLIVVALATSVVAAMVYAGCEGQRNSVVDYLNNAELQYEGEMQKENIIKGLSDALHLPPEILQGKRYKDYQGVENSWDLRALIHHHFVPDSKMKSLGSDFYRDITSEEGRKKVTEILKTLE